MPREDESWCVRSSGWAKQARYKVARPGGKRKTLNLNNSKYPKPQGSTSSLSHVKKEARCLLPHTGTLHSAREAVCQLLGSVILRAGFIGLRYKSLGSKGSRAGFRV